MNESSLPIAITGMSEMIRRVTRMNVTVRFNLCTKHSYIHVQMNHVTHMNESSLPIAITQTGREEIWPSGRNEKNQIGKSKEK